MHTALVRQALSRRTFFGAALLLAIGWSLTGCNTYVRYGDARLVQTPSVLLMGDSYIEFPKIPIGAPGTVSYRAPGHLTFTDFRLEVPEAEADLTRRDQPWRSAILRVKVVWDDGRVIGERRIDFARDWKGGSDSGEHRGDRALILSFPRLPSGKDRGSVLEFPPPPASVASLSSRLEVEVIRPSGRKTDFVRITVGR